MPATILWDGGPSGQGANWLDAANWVGDVLPGPNDDAMIGPAAPGQPSEITLTGTTAVRSATVTGVTLRLLNASFTGSLVNRGTVLAVGNDTISGSLTTSTGSTIRLLSDWNYGSCFLTAPSFINNGRIEILSNDRLYSSYLRVGPPGAPTGSLTNASGGTILASTTSRDVCGGVVQGAAFDNRGTVSVAPSVWLSMWMSGLSSNTGSIDIAPGGEFSIEALEWDASPDQQFINDGAITLRSGGPGRDGAFQCMNYRHRSGSLTGAGQVMLAGATFETDYTVAVSGWFALNYPYRSNDIPREVDGPGKLTIPAGYTLTIYQTINAPLLNQGTISLNSFPFIGLNSATVNGPLANSGTITVAADTTWNTSGDSTNSGTIDVSGGNLTLNQPAGATFRTTGTVNVANTRTFTINGGGYAQSGGATTLAGTLAVSGSFSQTGGTVAVALNGTTPGTQYGQVKANGMVAVGGPLVVNLGFAAALGDTFRIVDNDGSNSVTGTFAGLPEGARLTAGGKEFKISYVGGTGNDPSLTRVAPLPAAVPRVTAVRVNDGSAQRSRITNLDVTFSTSVTFAGAPAAAFTLSRDGNGAAVSFTASVTGDATVVTLSNFTGPAADAGSLADGTYTLTVLAGQIRNDLGPLDGNGDGTPGDNYTFGAAQGLVRKYGDANGDGWLDATDLALLRQTFGRVAGDSLYQSGFDVNGDGVINGIDLTRFRQAYTAGPPRVAAVQVSDGSAQRSRITSLTVTFSKSVTFAGPPSAAFVVTREDGTPVTFTATVAIDATQVTLDHFGGAAVDAGSLADGQYTLKVLAAQVSSPEGRLDGNRDGVPGDDYSFGAAQGLVRKYGDGNGDGKVDAADLAVFRQTFGRIVGDPLYLSWLDVNGDGAINGTDLTRFRQAYGAGG